MKYLKVKYNAIITVYLMYFSFWNQSLPQILRYDVIAENSVQFPLYLVLVYIYRFVNVDYFTTVFRVVEKMVSFNFHYM